MGNLGSRKKQKDEDVTDDVWLKLNNGEQKSPKGKKKKKKKRKKKDKRGSPDRLTDDTSQCDTCSYSQSTLSSRKLSDSTIASVGTLTNQHNDSKLEPRYANITDDQSNISIGYVTASDTFTPPSPRKGRHPKFSPVIAQDSPRVVRRLLQSDKILDKNEEPVEEKLSPRAKFFLSTPEPTQTTKSFENRKFSRHSSGSSLDSRTWPTQPDDKQKQQQSTSTRHNDNRFITNGSLIVKSRQHENKNNHVSISRCSNNSLEMSDSTTENLVKTGEKAKLIRYDGGNLSPAERRKNKQNEKLRSETNNATNETNNTTNGFTFDKFDTHFPKQGVKDDFIHFIITNECENKPQKTSPNNTCKNKERDSVKDLETLSLTAKTNELEVVPPPTPASGASLLEVDECQITESETCSEKHLSRDEEIFGDSVCKRLSLLLESEQDSEKLNRSEFHEFTDSSCSSPGIQQVPERGQNSEETMTKVNHQMQQLCDNFSYLTESQGGNTDNTFCETWNNSQEKNPEMFSVENDLNFSNNSKLELCYDNSDKGLELKTPQGKETASVLDVMNNNFRMNSSQDATGCSNDHSFSAAKNTYPYNKQKDFIKDNDIEEQMKYENEINEKLIEERIKTLQEILPPMTGENKRSSLLCAISNKHANDPDNYILVTKKTYCVKRGVLVELMDEEKDLLTRDVIKTIDDSSVWVTTGSKERYKPDTMVVEQGKNKVCPPSIVELENRKHFSDSDFSGSFSDPDYVNLEEFERNERELQKELQSDEEINFENVLNRSQSQSDSGSDLQRQSDVLCDVIRAYRDDEYSEYSDENSETNLFNIGESRVENRQMVSKRRQYSDEGFDKDVIYAENQELQQKPFISKRDQYSDKTSEDDDYFVIKEGTQSRKQNSKRSKTFDQISDELLFSGDTQAVSKPVFSKHKYSVGSSGDGFVDFESQQSRKFIKYSDDSSEEESVDFQHPQNRNMASKPRTCSDAISEKLFIKETQNRSEAIPKQKVLFDEFSDDDKVLFADNSPSDSGRISSKVIRTPSKLDQSLRKIFREKADSSLVTSQQMAVTHMDSILASHNTEVYGQYETAGYDSPQQKSSDGSRRSLAYTESDLDQSEIWDDDDASNDSMLADDEDDDDELGEIIFSKPYMEHQEKSDAMFSYSMVQTMPDSPIMWQPPADDDDDDDDVFQDIPAPVGFSDYQPGDDSSDEAFDDARKQMQEIHEQLQSLREQMITFENEEEESSLPTSPADDRILHIPKTASD